MGVDIIVKIAGVKRSDRDDMATFATLAGLIVVIVLVMDMVGGLFDTVKNILSLT